MTTARTIFLTLIAISAITLCTSAASADQWLKYDFNTESSLADADFLNTAPPVAGLTKNGDGQLQDGYADADPGDPVTVQLEIPGRKVIQGVHFKGESTSGNGTTIQPLLHGLNPGQNFPDNFQDAMSTSYWVSFDEDARGYMTLLSIGSNGHAPTSAYHNMINNQLQHHDHGALQPPPYSGDLRHWVNNGFYNHNPGHADAQNSGELYHLAWTQQKVGDFREEKMFVNGVLTEQIVAAQEYGPLTVSNGIAPRIGRNVANNANAREFFKGDLYQFEIYDEMLSDSAVAAMYAAGPTIHHKIVPEPATAMLAGLGFIGLGLRRRR